MRKGDTLIEVMFAIGIFSMVAISAVSVMSLGMMNTQTALETTMARNEIDGQAEALRFIQSAYLAEREASSTDGMYTKLWRKITRRVANGGYVNDATESITKFSPSSCEELYTETGAVNAQHAFVINGRKLADATDSNIESALVTGNKLGVTTTSPRLYYSDDMVESLDNSELTRAEGVYVVAVRDPGSNVVNEDSTASTSGAIYVDFYIRTCWYGQGNGVPSTISTVIRLYDPELQ